MSQWRNQKYLETNENGNKTYHLCMHQWDAAKAVLRGMFILINAYLRNKNPTQVILHLKKLEKESSKSVEGRK